MNIKSHVSIYFNKSSSWMKLLNHYRNMNIELQLTYWMENKAMKLF